MAALTEEMVLKIESLRTKLVDYHNEYIKAYDFGKDFEEVQKLRLFYLNCIRQDFVEYFPNERMIQIATNLLQVSFILRKELGLESKSLQYFDYLFLSSMYLCIKIENPYFYKKFKVLACDRKYDLKALFETERLILNRVNWKVNIHTAFDLMNILLESFIDSSEGQSEKEVKERALNWIAFSFDEYKLYQKYDQFTLTLAGVLNAFVDVGLVKSTQKLRDFMQSINVDRALVLACMNEMVDEVKKLDTTSDEVSTTGSDSRTASVSKEFVGKKRKRVRRRSLEQTQISQYMKQSKTQTSGRKKA